ncbi:MAG: BNR-4 repeat-containing protein, partial [Bacteroidales bacterium]
MSEDGAWSNNSEPGAVYYNGKTYFAWLNAKKNLIVSSYDHSSGEIKEQTLSTGYNDDFSSPAIAIRATGQILVFASNNLKEDGFYCWRSNAPEDISSWSGSQKQTGYGISSTTPLFMDNDLVVFWRSKNNVGYSLYKDIKGKDTALPAPAKRAGFIGTDIGNNYAHREEIPYMKVCQSADGTIHMVVTHLGTGKTYNNSTVHYIKIAKDATGSALTFRKADNSPLSGMNVTESKGCVLDTIASGSDLNKVWAYDITLNENNQPVVLYDKFIASGDKTTSAHTYYSATWNGHEWVSSQIAVAGDGLSLTQYKSVQGYTFDANSFQSGGICFDALNPSKVYLSKKNDAGFFSLYSYITSDNGVNWTQQEILSNDGANQDNIRPMTVMHAPQDYPVNVYWMRGTYENPTLFNTSVACAGESTAATGIFLDKNSYEGAMNTVLDIKVKVAPVFASDKEYLFESSNPDIIEVQSNYQIFCKAVGKATITVRLKNNPLLFATSEVNVLGQSVYSLFAERVIADLRADKMPETESLDLTVTQILSQLNADGS